MLYSFQSPSGLAPIEGERVSAETRALVCENITLRKGDIRPLRYPTPTALTVDPNPDILLENPATGTVIGGTFGDGWAVDQFRANGLTYAVLNGVALLLQGDTINGTFTPARPTTAPVVDVTPVPVVTQYNIGDELDAISAVDTPVNNVSNNVPGMITYNATALPAAREYPVATIMAAMNYVLDNYRLDFLYTDLSTSGVGLPGNITLRHAVENLTAAYNSQSDIVRRWEQGGSSSLTQTTPFANIKPELDLSIQAMVYHVMTATYRELTGSWYTLIPPVVRFAPAFAKATTAEALITTFYVDLIPAVSGATYTQGAGVVFQYVSANNAGAQLVGDYVGGSWRQNSSGDTDSVAAIKQVYELALNECAAARADPTGYVWYGLHGSTFTNAGQLRPFVVGTDTLRPGGEEYSAPVPRAYCYTWIDTHGRESRPSEPTVVTGQNDLGAAADHTVFCPDTPPPSANVGLVALYRMVVPHEADDQESAGGVWARIGVYPVTTAQGGVASPPVGDASYAVLTTVHDEPHPDTPMFLAMTESGHSVCTNQARDLVLISKRHMHWAFPFNRRFNLPVGLQVENLKVVGNAVYVATRDYPILLNIGEDRGDEGLQVEATNLVHARYGCKPRSMVETGWGVLMWSDVGLLAISGVNVTVASITLIDDDQVEDYTANACAAYHQGMYFGFRSNGSVYMFDIPDTTFGEQVKAPLTKALLGVKAALVTQSGALLLAMDGDEELHEWNWREGAFMPIAYQTALVKLPSDVVLSAVKVHGSGVSGQLSCYDSRGLRWTRTIQGDTPMRIPSIRLHNYLSLRFEGTANYISNLEIASGMRDLSGI